MMNSGWIHALWPFNRSRQYYNEPTYSGGYTIETNIFKEAWRIMPCLLVAQQISSGLTYFYPILMVVLLSELVDNMNVLMTNTMLFVFLLAWVVLQFANNVWSLWLHMEINEKLCRKINHLAHSYLKPGLSQDTVRRVCGRDIGIIVENNFDALELLSLSIVSLVSCYFVYSYYGLEVALSMAILSVYIPLTIFLSKKGDSLYANIMRVSARRMEECSRWLRWGPFLNNWEKSNKLCSIRDELQNEVNCRNKDSIVRGIDIYVSSFGRILPYIFVSLYFLGEDSAKEGMFGVFWLAYPILMIILHYPRIYVAFKNVERSLTEISSVITSVDGIKKDITTSMVVDHTWTIWEGTIAENIFYTDNTTDELFSVFKFVPEFGDSIEAVLDYRLESHGANLSEGQKVRLIIARAVNMALATETPLEIKVRFNSIDDRKLTSVLNYLNSPEIAHFVILRHECSSKSVNIKQEDKAPETDSKVFASALTQTKQLNIRKNTTPEYKTHVLRNLVGLWRFETLFMLVPAFILSYLGHLAYQSASFLQLISMFAIAVIGFLLAVLVGAAIERKIRTSAMDILVAGLSNIRNIVGINDKFQIISRDYLTVNERISWYCHDLAWIISLISILFVVMVVTINIFGIVIVMIYGLVFTYLWKKLIPYIVESRLASVNGVNTLLSSMQNINNINHSVIGLSKNNHIYDMIYQYRQKHAFHGMKEYYLTHSQMMATKVSLSNYAQLGSGLFMLSIIAVLFLSSVSPAIVPILLTAFLMVAGEVTRLFLAISGFKSQILSLHRLKRLSDSSAVGDEIFVCIQGDFLTIQSFSVCKSKLKYSELSTFLGESYSLTGESGSGKSQYLKSVAGFESVLITDQSNDHSITPAQNRQTLQLNDVRVVYCDQQIIEITQWENDDSFETLSTDNVILSVKAQENRLKILVDFAKEMMQKQTTLLIYDEALSSLGLPYAIQCAQQIEQISSENDCVFLLVDHRFTLDRTVSIMDLVATK